MTRVLLKLIQGFLLLPGILVFSTGCRVTSPSEDHQRIIEFSGYSWKVKSSKEPIGPGPNNYSKDEDNVWVDNTGALHLTIRKNGDSWYCSEVISMNRFSYGIYSFELETRVDLLDPAVVLGLFTWNPAPGNHNREVDIEFTRLGNPGLLNAHYVVQPYHFPFHHHRFSYRQKGDISTHQFEWGLKSIVFSSFNGSVNGHAAPELLQQWSYSPRFIKRPGRPQVRINLWLFNGSPPLNKSETEVVIRSFSFTPVSLWRPTNG